MNDTDAGINTKTLRTAAVAALKARGYAVESYTGRGRPEGTFLKLSKEGGKDAVCTVRSTRDRWIAFHYNREKGSWDTLDKATFVAVAAASKDKRRAEVHFFDAAAVRESFDSAYKARTEAGHVIRQDTPWIGLDEPTSDTVTSKGSGLAKKALWREVIDPETMQPEGDQDAVDDRRRRRFAWGPDDLEVVEDGDGGPVRTAAPPTPARLTIQEAKEALAATFGVPPDAIEITIRG